MTFRDRIDKILEIKKLSLHALNQKSGFGQGTIKAAYDLNRELSELHEKKFLEVWGISLDWWKAGRGEIFYQNGTPAIKSNNNEVSRETFYRDLMERNEQYSIIPRAVLTDYKIVPDKIIDVIISSNENEKRALLEAKQMEVESLNEKHEQVIEGLKNKNNRLNDEKEKLENEIIQLEKLIEDLRGQIPGQS